MPDPLDSPATAGQTNLLQLLGSAAVLPQAGPVRRETVTRTSCRLVIPQLTMAICILKKHSGLMVTGHAHGAHLTLRTGSVIYCSYRTCSQYT